MADQGRSAIPQRVELICGIENAGFRGMCLPSMGTARYSRGGPQMSRNRRVLLISCCVLIASGVMVLGQVPKQPTVPKQAAQPAAGQTNNAQPQQASDAVAVAQTPRRVEAARPEQQLTDRDRPERFSAKRATPSSP